MDNLGSGTRDTGTALEHYLGPGRGYENNTIPTERHVRSKKSVGMGGGLVGYHEEILLITRGILC